VFVEVVEDVEGRLRINQRAVRRGRFHRRQPLALRTQVATRDPVNKKHVSNIRMPWRMS
jgi:hypothetical protein